MRICLIAAISIKVMNLFSLRKVFGLFKIQILKNHWIAAFVCLRSNSCSFKDGYDRKKTLKCVSKSQAKHKKFENFKKSLDGEKYQEDCKNYFLRSINVEMYLQGVKKTTLSFFDDKRLYESKIESEP